MKYHGEIRVNSRLVFAIILIIVMMSMILSTVFLSGLTISFATAATETTLNPHVYVLRAVFSTSHNIATTIATTTSTSVNNSGSSSFGNKFVVINFDDGYKNQFTAATPILDKYGFKASFFIVCNFVGKTGNEMNSTSVGNLNGAGNFTGKGVEQMTWQDIMTLYKEGHQIGSHSMNHVNNMSRMSDAKLEYEIGQSKQCLLKQGIPVNTFAFPFTKGQDNATIVAKEAKYYSYVRTGVEPLMFLHCDHYQHKPNQTDCRTYFPNGKVTFANRYSIIGWNPEGEKSKHSYNDTKLLQRFIQVVNSQLKYNKLGKPVEAIPVIYYHKIDNSGAVYSTHPALFAAEMKYLHDNGFKVIRMDNLVYNNATSSFYLKNQ
jgi:peptidoglycan/xylan/chitin deacetylase (PgdA/CDA1 family)